MMAKTGFKSVDEYIATHRKDVQAIRQRVRRTIRKAVPGAETEGGALPSLEMCRFEEA
jgi:hypothetical protein